MKHHLTSIEIGTRSNLFFGRVITGVVVVIGYISGVVYNGEAERVVVLVEHSDGLPHLIRDDGRFFIGEATVDLRLFHARGHHGHEGDAKYQVSFHGVYSLSFSP